MLQICVVYDVVECYVYTHVIVVLYHAFAVIVLCIIN